MPLPDWWEDRIAVLRERDERGANLVWLLGQQAVTHLNGSLTEEAASALLSTYSREPWRLEGDLFDRELLRFVEAWGWSNPDGVDPEQVELHKKVEALRPRVHSGIAVCAIPPPTPLVDSLLFTPGESVAYSPPGVGKTFLALDLHLSIATGRPFMGHNTTRSPSLYVAAEGVGGLGARVAAWCSYHQQTDIGDAHFLTTAINLSEPSAVDVLIGLANDLCCRLVILDTLARCMVGVEENSAKDIGNVVQNLDRLRDAVGHVHLVHHMGKDSTKGMRGSTALLGAVDTTLELAGDPKAIRVAVTKQKDAEAVPEWYCHLVAEQASAVIRPVSDVEMVTASQRTVLEALEQLPDEDRTSTKWQAMAEEMGISRATFWRAKKWLETTQRVSGGKGRGERYVLQEMPPEVPDDTF